MFLCKVLEDSFRPDTVLVSIMTVNNEIGVRQPIEEIGMLQICLVTSRTLDITSDIPTSLIELLFIVVALGTLTLSVGVRKCIRLITSFRCKNPPKAFSVGNFWVPSLNDGVCGKIVREIANFVNSIVA